MKRFFFCIIFFVAITAQSQKNKTVHSFNIWGQGGYCNLFVKYDCVRNRGGDGYIFGLGYGLQKNHFILETGIEFDYKRSLSKYDDCEMQVGKFIDQETGEEIPIGTKITAEMHKMRVEGGFIHTYYNPLNEPENNPENKFVMKYNFTGLQDLYKISYINVPVRVGGMFDWFYFLVGGKFGLNVLSYCETSGKHSSTAYFPQDIGYLSDMPHHSFVNNKESSDITHFNRELGLNFVATAEVGVNFMQSDQKKAFREVRLAFFADYGVNIYSKKYISTENTNGDFVYIPALDQVGLDPNIVKYNSLLTSNIKPRAYPFIVGVKVTLLFSHKKAPNPCPSKPSSWWVFESKKRR